ncbi:MAG: hypothetical protein AUI83_07665 [Armatimonadetes bacterium 13_1_40CM_3_65_7]|nr:MAG: hypothetical protein AUI83_07665 [Armatimonadetes bacterium 13_1_40CM_3_65_7]
MTVAGGIIQQLSRFVGTSEDPFTKSCINIFGCGPNHRNFRIVYQHGTVGGNRSHKLSFHQIDQEWGQSGFYHVPADSPDDRFAKLARAPNLGCKFAQTLNGENVRQ